MKLNPCPYCPNEDRSDNANAIRKGAKGNCKRAKEESPPCLEDATGIHIKKAKTIPDRVLE